MTRALRISASHDCLSRSRARSSSHPAPQSGQEGQGDQRVPERNDSDPNSPFRFGPLQEIEIEKVLRSAAGSLALL